MKLEMDFNALATGAIKESIARSSTGATQIHAEMMDFAMILMMIIVADVQQDFWAKTVKLLITVPTIHVKMAAHV